MVKKVLWIIAFILFLNLISASYNCSYGSLIEDKDEIGLGDIKLVNGLEIGLIKSDESILQRYSAEVLVDAGKFYLNNDTNFTEDIELKKEEKTVKLLNLTEDIVEIKVDGDSESIDIYEDEIVIIDSFKVFILDTEGIYPGTASVEGIIGTSSASLDNNDSSKIITIEDIEYLIKLFSASDSDATIIVGRCENETAKIIEVADSVVETPSDNSDSNITLEDNLSNESESSEDTINQTPNLEESVKKPSSKSGENVFKIVVGLVSGLIVIVFVIFLSDILKRGSKYSKEE